jgi:hypothetical protein
MGVCFGKTLDGNVKPPISLGTLLLERIGAEL